MEALDVTKAEKIRFKDFFDHTKQAELPLEIEPTAKNAYMVFKACENGTHDAKTILEMAKILRAEVAGDLDYDQFTADDWSKFINLIRNF